MTVHGFVTNDQAANWTDKAVYGRVYVSGALADADATRENVALVKQHLAQVLDVDKKDLSFSRRAGCSCGCSPGFVSRDARHMHRHLWVEFVEVSD